MYVFLVLVFKNSSQLFLNFVPLGNGAVNKIYFNKNKLACRWAFFYAAKVQKKI